MPCLGLGSCESTRVLPRTILNGWLGDDKLRMQHKLEHKKYKKEAPSEYLLDVSEIVPGAAGGGD